MLGAVMVCNVLRYKCYMRPDGLLFSNGLHAMTCNFVKTYVRFDLTGGQTLFFFDGWTVNKDVMGGGWVVGCVLTSCFGCIE